MSVEIIRHQPSPPPEPPIQRIVIPCFFLHQDKLTITPVVEGRHVHIEVTTVRSDGHVTMAAMVMEYGDLPVLIAALKEIGATV